MEAFNASHTVQPQRLAGYEERYIILVPIQEVRGFRVPDGAELHQDNGSIELVEPGGWVIEAPNGRLVGLSPQEIADGWRPKEDGDEDFEQTKVDVSEPDPADAPPAPEDEPEREKTPDELRRELETRLLGVANAQASQALTDGLITPQEAAGWTSTGEAPPGIVIDVEDDGTYTITREPGHGPAGVPADAAGGVTGAQPGEQVPGDAPSDAQISGAEPGDEPGLAQADEGSAIAEDATDADLPRSTEGDAGDLNLPAGADVPSGQGDEQAPA